MEDQGNKMQFEDYVKKVRQKLCIDYAWGMGTANVFAREPILQFYYNEGMTVEASAKQIAEDKDKRKRGE